MADWRPDTDAVLRTGPTVTGNNRFIRLVIVLLRVVGFANLLGRMWHK